MYIVNSPEVNGDSYQEGDDKLLVLSWEYNKIFLSQILKKNVSSNSILQVILKAQACSSIITSI